MTNPAPRKPNKVTITVNEHGFDALVEVFEPNPNPSPELKEFIERRKRERREKREREARERGENPPPAGDTPPSKPAE